MVKKNDGGEIMKGKNLPKLISLFVILVAFVAIGSRGQCLDYPEKNILAICPWPAGSASGNAFKGYLGYVEKHLGGKIIVDYRPGGIGGIAWIAVKNSKPDGYTMGMLTVSIFQLDLEKMADVSYRDFEVLNMFTFHPMAIFIHADSPWRTIKEFRTYAQKHPGELKCGYEGAGLINVNLVSEAMGIKMIPIPFKGTNDSLAALLGKHVEVLCTSIPLAIPHVKAGTLHMLGVLADSRLEGFPETPTFKERGYDVVRGSFRIIVVPKGTPRPVVDKLNIALKKAFYDPEFQKWAKKVNISHFYMAPAETNQFMRTSFEIEKEVRASMKKK